ncbi:YbbR-like domain-containing protein [Bacillus sp. AGMB 02131]|uniref:YbbR-like domain-containing protein n=1 Tax=Peribacillus faecalis TaxID=2772559 RepID=A0A927D039_9BACI|nr:CdaR family protein [Peribacillus faecalis]MBD3109105.1 YbbR-like domain-containing protein [Peribacillus faecalis]
MDKLFETPWFLKVVALVLAALLYISTNFDIGSGSSSFNTPAQTDTVVIESVPVEVYYDRDNLVVTGVPETVDVTLEGPKNLLVITKNSRDFSLFIDLSDQEIELGTRSVAIEVRDLNDRLTATVDPRTVEVTIEEKITKKFTVTPEFDRSLLEDGYIAEAPTVNPTTVEVTGAKSTIDSIAYVKAIINLQEGVNDSVTLKAPVQAFDENYNKLEVEIDPGTVEVEVPIVSPSKTMSIVPVESGEPASGVTIEDIEVQPSEITLYGKQKVLDTIEDLQLPVDISNIKENTTVTMPIDLPEGITASSAEEVTVKITVKSNADTEEDNPDENTENEDVDVSRVFSNLRIQYVGLEDTYELSFIEPSQGVTNVSLTGKKSIINGLKSSDIQVSIDVTDLGEGEHSAPVTVNTPNNTEAKSSVSVAKVSIVKKESPT